MSISRQRILVVFLSVLVFAAIMPAAIEGWQQHATFGMRILRAGTLVRSVEPGSPADRAGIVAGDAIDVAALGLHGHLVLMNPRNDDRLTMTVVHGDTRRPVTLTAVPAHTSDAYRWLIVGDFLSTATFIVVGAMLVYLRASPMTWFLWLYGVGIAPVNELLNYYAFLPRDVFAGVWLVGRVFLGGFSVFPLLPFVLRFPYGHIGGWRKVLRPWLIALVAVAFVYYVAIAWIGLRYGLAGYSLLNAIPALILYLVAAGLLTTTYLRAHGVDRQRLKWAVTGMLVAFATQILQYIPAATLVAPAAEVASIVMPICVAYAVLRHRLIDVQFVINRAIVYGILTAFLLAFVSLLDWFTASFISEYHLAKYLEAGATIAMGFVLDRLHTALDAFTDRVFFRARHEAEQHLARVARSLGFAMRIESIEEAVVDEPVRCLKLASAALFRRDEARGTFVRGRSLGWADDDLREFADDAPLIRYLRSDEVALSARDARLDPAGLPRGTAAPALYLPIFCREVLTAVAIFGAHANGSGLDPDEVALLGTLAPGAGLAFDHLSYELLRRELADLTERGATDDQPLAGDGKRPNPVGPSLEIA